MKKIFELLIFCLLLSLAMLIISCGTRKTDTNNTETKKDSIIINNTYSQSTKTILMDIFTAKPIDALKPMWINGKEYINAVISNDKSMIHENKIYITNRIGITTTTFITKTKAVTSIRHDLLYLGMFLIIIFAVWSWFKFKM